MNLGHNHFFMLFFGALTVCSVNQSAMAVGGGTPAVFNPSDYVFTSLVAEPAHAVVDTICHEGTYLVKCGGKKLGFNWLRSATFTNPTDPNSTLTTRNYYNGVTNKLDRLEQMRGFFNGNSSLLYSNGSQILTASPEDVANDRYTVLTNMCNRFDPSKQAECSPCPNNAKVKPSTVVLDSQNNTHTAWKVRTFADCYIDEFQDSTGNYVYIADNATFENPDTTAENCYYTGGNYSSLHGSFISGQLNVIEAVITDNIDTTTSLQY